MTTTECFPLSFGQLSVLRDVRKNYVGRESLTNLILFWEVMARAFSHCETWSASTCDAVSRPASSRRDLT